MTVLDDTTIFRLYGPEECRRDGYPRVWHDLGPEFAAELPNGRRLKRGVKHLVREVCEQRCERCAHPYVVGEHRRGEWTPCDDRCSHGGPFRAWSEYGDPIPLAHEASGALELLRATEASRVEAQWRILTVHHLNGVKSDLRWWNLAALCQRCHLQIQGKVLMERIWPWDHTPWFRPHAAGWYATAYLEQDLTYSETMVRLDELLGLERVA